jgi:hypothetical protein
LKSITEIIAKAARRLCIDQLENKLYHLENKLYHGAIIATGLTAIGSGVFMMFRAPTIFFPRNPHLFSDMTWV